MRLTKISIAMTFTALLAGAMGAPTVQAGTYEVHACNAGVAGGANNSFYPVASAGLTAFTECPAGQGMTVRNGWDNGNSGFLDGAHLIFDAPGGNVVENVAFEAGFERHDCSWGLGVIASGFDLGGTRVWGFAPGVDCGAGQTPGATNFFQHQWTFGVNAQRVRFEARCGAGSCPRTGIAAFRVKNVVVRVKDDAGPSLENGRGALWTEDRWLAGTHSVGFDAKDAAGIRSARIFVDGREVASKSFACDNTRPAPCPDGALEEPSNTVGWGGDGEHTVTLTATDAAGNDGSASRTVKVDNTAPSAPVDLALEGGDGWRSKNEFDLRWGNPAQSAAPVAGAHWEVCKEGADKDCERGYKEGEGITSLSDFKIPAPGAYVLKVWLRDAAGNQDDRLATAPMTLRYDDASPDVALDPLTAEDPTRVTAMTSDRGSGVAAGTIELRPRGAETWTPMETTLEGDRLVARINDEALGDGVFDLRARVADYAGNERSTTNFSGGQPAQVTLPLRLKTVLAAGVVQRSGKKTKLVSAARVRYGQLVRVSGRLTSPEGNPLQDLEVQAVTQIRDGVTPPRVIATVKSSKTGRFSFLVRKGPSRSIQVRYAGAPQVRGATRVLALNVRAQTTMRPNRRTFVNGEAVRFRGALTTGRIPGAGKLVELQVRSRGQWRTFATTRSGPKGTWRHDYRFDGTKGRVTYKFRARVPRESGYPFVTGDSRSVSVRVRGL